jgi:hypothetical protein
VTAVDEPDVGVGEVTLEGFGPGGQEEWIILVSYREQRGPAGAEVLLERRVAGHVAGVVEEQVELDLIGAGARQVVTGRALPSSGLRRR